MAGRSLSGLATSRPPAPPRRSRGARVGQILLTAARGLGGLIAANAAAFAAVISALVAAAALTYTGQQAEATRAQVAVAQQGQFTDRYTRAVAQLSDPNAEIRLGGVYALERLTHDSPPDQPSIVAVLTSFLRDKLPRAGTSDCGVLPTQASGTVVPAPADLQAALTVLSRRNRAADIGPADLSGTCLRQIELPDTMTGFDLSRTDLTGTTLLSGLTRRKLDLAGDDLSQADLSNAVLPAVRLEGADLTSAELSGAQLIAASARRIAALGVDLSRANMGGADLTGSGFEACDFSDADLDSANLTDTTLSDSILIRSRFDGAL